MNANLHNVKISSRKLLQGTHKRTPDRLIYLDHYGLLSGKWLLATKI